MIYDDPTGDSGTAPDLTSVEVANDASGYIAFRVALVQSMPRDDVRVVVAIDSDRNPKTGFEGTDYLLLAVPATDSYALAHWDGTEFVDTPETTLTALSTPTSETFSLNRSELGNSDDFDFWARTVQGSTFAPGHFDAIPDAGTLSYELGEEAPMQLMVERSSVGRARAGKPFVALVEITRSDVILPDVTAADVACRARIGARRLGASAHDGLGAAAGCLWRLPKKTRGKLLRASVTVALDGTTVTKTFAARIK